MLVDSRSGMLRLCGLALLIASGCGDHSAEPQAGAIEVSLAIPGSLPDPDGCQVSVGGDPVRLLDGGRHVFRGLLPGTHVVEISDVALNCTVQGQAARAVEVVADQTTIVPFTVDCPGLGSIFVETRSTGSMLDPDGYELLLDGSETQPVGLADTVTVRDIPAGRHELTLGDLAQNCRAIGSNPLSVAVSEQVTSSATFDIVCPPFHDHIVFSSNRSGDSDLWVMESDGSNLVNVTPDPAWSDAYPVWSPDATRIAFLRSPRGGGGLVDVWILDTATLTQARVTEAATGGLCSWSPEGDRLVYGDSGDIFIVGADGSQPVNLTPGPETGWEPAWSPDGLQIAFVSDRESGSNVWVMGADGSNPTRITDLEASVPAASWHPAYEPAWAPDGTRIAFSGPAEQGVNNIWVIDVDGSNLIRLTEDVLAYQAWRPAWSPDGLRIAFWAFRPESGHSYEIFVMGADGSDPTNLTDSPSADTDPSWSPGS